MHRNLQALSAIRVRSQIGVLGKLSWPSSGPEGYFKALFLSGCGYPVLGPERAHSRLFCCGRDTAGYESS